MVSRRRYTVWACAALRDHVHLCVRVHRDDYETMWRVVTEEASNALQEVRADWKGRPIWADRPYSVYLKTVADVWRVVRYIEGNPKKHGLGEQAWGFVKEYDEWPFHKRNGRSH